MSQSKKSKISDFQDLDHIDGVAISAISANLYKENRNFGEAAIYYAGLIMVLDGVAGAVAANTFVKTSLGYRDLQQY